MDARAVAVRRHGAPRRDVEEIAATERTVSQGQMPDRPFVLVGQQYVADPTRSRDGVHPLYAYAHVPSGYTGDATEAITSQIERFAPGFRERILATHVRTTADLEAGNANFVGGDIIAGANTARQLVARPRVTLHPYATGVRRRLPLLRGNPAGRRRPRHVRLQRGALRPAPRLTARRVAQATRLDEPHGQSAVGVARLRARRDPPLQHLDLRGVVTAAPVDHRRTVRVHPASATP